MKKSLLVAGSLAALAGAGFIGRITAPVKVEEREVEKVRVVTVEKIDTQRVSELMEENRLVRSQLDDLKKTVRREVRVVKRPDGTVEKVKVEDINIEQSSRRNEVAVGQVQTTATETQHVDRSSDATRSLERQKITTQARPDWLVGPMVGLNAKPGSALLPGIANYGIMIQHRIVGPISGGGWLLSSGQAGVILTLEL